MTTETIIAIATTLVLAVVVTDVFKWMRKKKKKDKEVEISFKETFDLIDVPIVTFKMQGKNKERKLNFVIDTGANECIIDEKDVKTLDQNKVDYFELDDPVVQGVSDMTTSSKGCYLELVYNNMAFVSPFSIVDLTQLKKYIKDTYGVWVAGMIGSNFLNTRNADIDFEIYKLTLKNGTKKTDKGDNPKHKIG